jgi:hypothetical protein
VNPGRSRRALCKTLCSPFLCVEKKLRQFEMHLIPQVLKNTLPPKSLFPFYPYIFFLTKYKQQ